MDREKCVELHKACNNCGRKFKRVERYIDCPDCGTSRKCGHMPVRGSTVCTNHRGPKQEFPGMGRPVVSGTRSTNLVARLASKYLQVNKDPLYVSLRHSLYAVRSRIGELFERVGENYDENRIGELKTLWEKYKNQEWGDYKHKLVAQKKIDAVFERAFHDYQSWNQIMKLIDLEGKQAEREMKILKEMKALMTVDDGMELVAKMAAVCIKELQDEPNLLKRILRGLTKIVGTGTLDRAGAGSGEVIDYESGIVDREEFLHTGDSGRPDPTGEDSTRTIPEGLSE